jgi:hypothetical protein
MTTRQVSVSCFYCGLSVGVLYEEEKEPNPQERLQREMDNAYNFIKEHMKTTHKAISKVIGESKNIHTPELEEEFGC